MQPPFYKVPPEIWGDVVAHLGTRDLASIALTSKETYSVANRLLYSTLELSFCKCSDAYYDLLARTFTDHPELAALVTHLLIDMKVPCGVKATTSFDDILQTKSLFNPYTIFMAMTDNGRYGSPRGQVDWNKEALRTLSSPNAIDILAQLCNVEKLTVILGLFQQSSEILTSLLQALPAGVLPSMHFLKVYDATLDSTSLRSISALRVLDLGYVNVDGTELCTIVGQNAGTLEEIRLCWIIEPTQKPLFGDYEGSAIKNLRVFTSQGPYPHSFSGLRRLLGNASMLEVLRLESQSVLSALVWGQIFSELISEDNWSSQRMRVLKLGAPAGCSDFWESAVKFLCRCGNGLTSLHINGTSRIAVGPVPPGLLRYFSSHPQSKLSSLVLIWRDEIGLSPESAIALRSYAPALGLLHVCLAFPPNIIDDLLGMTKGFPKLRRAHFVFLKSGLPGSDQRAPHVYDKMVHEIDRKGPIFREFVRRAVAQHEELDEVSWSVHFRRAYSSQGPKAFVKINRFDADASRPTDSAQANSSAGSVVVKDLGEECRKYEISEPPRFRCAIGSKRVLLSQRPGWRDEMGNPYLDTRRVCEYAEFDVGPAPRPQQREL